MGRAAAMGPAHCQVGSQWQAARGCSAGLSRGRGGGARVRIWGEGRSARQGGRPWHKCKYCRGSGVGGVGQVEDPFQQGRHAALQRSISFAMLVAASTSSPSSSAQQGHRGPAGRLQVKAARREVGQRAARSAHELPCAQQQGPREFRAEHARGSCSQPRQHKQCCYSVLLHACRCMQPSSTQLRWMPAVRCTRTRHVQAPCACNQTTCPPPAHQCCTCSLL